MRRVGLERLGATCLATLLSIASAAAASDDAKAGVILRTRLQEMGALLQQYDLRLLDGVVVGQEDALLLVEGAPQLTASDVEGLVAGDPRVQACEQAQVASLPETDDQGFVADGDEADVTPDLLRTGVARRRCLKKFFHDPPWAGYAWQQAAVRTRLPWVQFLKRYCGRGVVAIVDTGVDPEHPLLVDALVPGYDFLLEQPGPASEWSSLDQSISPIVEQSISPIVEQSISPIVEGRGGLLGVNQSISPIVEQSVTELVAGVTLPPAFGHGTMVAGVVRLAAPGAKIMPLRAFDGDGRAELFDVIRAIYFAVDSGADVLNMSFSTPEPSAELRNAIEYAAEHGVVAVAAVGNRGVQEIIYPAAWAEVVGVASTDRADRRSSFSNFGAATVFLAAPGEGLISAYPGGLYAAGWGTSFSAPLVAGVAAVMVQLAGKETGIEDLLLALELGARPLFAAGDTLGSGRLDVAASLFWMERLAEDDD